MSIAVNRRSQAAARRFVATIPAERSTLSPNEQMREARSQMRHFVLAFAAAAAGVYTLAAVGLPF